MQDLIFFSEKENVIIKMLRKRLSDNGISSMFCVFDPVEIVANWDQSDIMVIYFDKPVNELAEEFDTLGTANLAENKKIIIIGGNQERYKLAEYIPDDFILASYDIPLDTVSFLTRAFEEVAKPEQTDYYDDNIERSILIVDDDAALMSTIRVWLKDIYKIQLANTGMNALRWLKDNVPDLIILDFEMPLMSGPELFQKLKEDDRLKAIPVIFMTGKDDKNSVMDVLSLKPEGYLLKPVEKDKMLQEIKDLFRTGNKR